jgi:hypothetical protein
MQNTNVVHPLEMWYWHVIQKQVRFAAIFFFTVGSHIIVFYFLLDISPIVARLQIPGMNLTTR